MPQDKPRIGVVPDDGQVLDVGAEAKRQKLTLAFDPDSMLPLIGSGDKGLMQVHTLV